MKIQCNACEAAEARVLCCADEAALCWQCDEKIHAANKLASKHQRVPLSPSSSPMPTCDICQETSGYFFCLEDRALLCRKCDVAIHTANSYVSGHQRFLLTGVKVGLEAAKQYASSAMGNLNSVENASSTVSSESISRGNAVVPSTCITTEALHGQLAGVVPLVTNKVPFAGGTTPAPGSIPEWHLDQYLGLADFSQSYVVMDNALSKAYSRGLGDSKRS